MSNHLNDFGDRVPFEGCGHPFALYARRLLSGVRRVSGTKLASSRELLYIEVATLPLAAFACQDASPERAKRVREIMRTYGRKTWERDRMRIFTPEERQVLRHWIIDRVVGFRYGVLEEPGTLEEFRFVVDAAFIVASVLVTPSDINNLPAQHAGF